MSLKQMTPIRQITRAYGALLNIPASLDAVSAQQQAIANESKSLVDAALAQAARQQEAVADAMKSSFDEAVAKVLAAAEVMKEPPATPVSLYDRMGFRLLLDTASMLDKRVVDVGEWEPEQVAYMTMLMGKMYGKPNAVFLDIGSYWGLYSLLANRSNAFQTIHAFEADRHNFAQLQANLFLNQATKVVASHNKAVGEKNGTLFMWDSTSHPDGSRAGVGVVDETSGLPGIRMPSVSIDSALGLSDCHILMKIDVEGFEPPVLRGMAQTVERNKVVMQVEVYDENKDAVIPEIEALGLRQIHAIYPDRYLTNMPQDELGL